MAASRRPGQRTPAEGLYSCGLPFPANHGTPGSIREMSEAIAERGHEVHIVTYHMGEDIPVKGPRIHRVPRLTGESGVVVGPTVRRPLYDLQMVFKTLEVIRDYRPDVLHAHGYESALAGWICQLLTGVPMIFSGHCTMGDELASYNFIRPRWVADGLARLLDGLVPRLANRCIPHSSNIQKFLFGMGLRRRTEPIVNFGIDVDRMARGDGTRIRRRYGLGSGPVILYSGVMDRFQRLDLLLEAMVMIKLYEPQAKLLFVVTIVNELHLASTRRRASELGLDDNVVFTDPQPLGSIGDCLMAGDVAVVPRPQASGFPIKLLNYMAARRPCVLYASSASRGLVHRDNVFLAAPNTGQALGEAILEVLRDDELRQHLARNGHRFVLQHHDRRMIAQQLCASYLRTQMSAGRASVMARRPRVTTAAIDRGFQAAVAAGPGAGNADPGVASTVLSEPAASFLGLDAVATR